MQLVRTSKRVSDIESYQFEKSNLFYLFYPADNKLCFAQRNSRDIRIFSFDYGSAGGDANGIGPSPGSLTRVKSAFWDELKKVGLGREVIETKYGIGHAIESLTSGDIGSSLDLLAKLNEKYACVQCGENAGAIVFANDPARCWMSERQDEHYISLLRKKGFSCDNVLNAYILMAVMFNHKDLHYDRTRTGTRPYLCSCNQRPSQSQKAVTTNTGFAPRMSVRSMEGFFRLRAPRETNNEGTAKIGAFVAGLATHDHQPNRSEHGPQPTGAGPRSIGSPLSNKDPRSVGALPGS